MQWYADNKGFTYSPLSLYPKIDSSDSFLSNSQYYTSERLLYLSYSSLLLFINTDRLYVFKYDTTNGSLKFNLLLKNLAGNTPMYWFDLNKFDPTYTNHLLAISKLGDIKR